MVSGARRGMLSSMAIWETPSGCIGCRIGVEASPETTRSQGGTVRRESIALIWIGGLVLALVLYAVGPDRFVEACLDLMDSIDAIFRALVYRLGAQVFNVVRALAIAIYVVFAVLAFLAVQRGLRGFWALVVVTVIFLMLVWRPYGDLSAPVGRWIVALALVVIGAAVMTQRLLAPPLRRDLPPPYPP